MENLKFIIVGHVDHGKSTLIGRLLFDTNSIPPEKIEEIEKICEALGKEIEFSYILDNLEEERDQGITIDIIQTFFSSNRRNYTIIDSPGHIEFLKNMITGTTQAEAAILIVDAEEGVKEQTKRHAFILNMLGVRQVIVVINKIDKVNYEQEKFDEVSKEVICFLNKLDIKPKFIIPISAKRGDNVVNKSKSLLWYSGPTVLEALDSFDSLIKDNNKPLRFSVQDVYNFDKRIIVGRVESGQLRVGDEIIVMPSNEITRVKTIEEFMKKDIMLAESGKATGLVTEDKLFIDRGNIISSPKKKPEIRDEFISQIFWMDKEPLKKDERIVMKCSTQKTVCKITEFIKVLNSSTLEEYKERKEIKNKEVAHVRIKTDDPIVIENFNDVQELGRFVLERLNTSGGGIITEKLR